LPPAKRRPDPSDGRVVNVAITKEGEAMLEEALATRTEVLRRRIEPLSAGDRRSLAAAVVALRKLVDGS
jgi:DNA-binding MarR family transcriptional regulator